MNVIEKILVAHSNKEYVESGEIINVSLDYIMSNDATTTLAIDIFKNQLYHSGLFSKSLARVYSNAVRESPDTLNGNFNLIPVRKYTHARGGS